MNKERLLRLASRMEKVKPEHFDIRNWSTVGAFDPYGAQGSNATGAYGQVKKLPDYVEYTEKGQRKVLLREGFCGSTACVLGQAALIREFNEQGLYIDLTGDGINTQGGAAGIVYIDENGNEFFGQIAGEKFFDLTGVEASILFYAYGSDITAKFYGAEHSGRITPQQVATALRRFVETDGQSLRDLL